MGTSKADCSSGITKCACNRQPQLLCLCHGEEEVRLVNGNNYLILEMQCKKMKEKGSDVLLESQQSLKGQTTDSVWS